MGRKPASALVYRTDAGRICQGCVRPLAQCVCRHRKDGRAGGVVYVGRSTKGRRGAGVTLVTNLPLGDEALAAHAKALKALCAVGGTVKVGVIELQGDQRDRVAAWLRERGYEVKLEGG